MTLGAIDADYHLQDVSLVDRLSCIADDLVELERNRPFLDRLFANGSGQWLSVDTLCLGLQDVWYELRELRLVFKEDLKVTWLDYPNSSKDQGTCVLIFFAETAHWSKLILMNRGSLNHSTLCGDRLSETLLSSAKYLEPESL
jgi:hypothetical protein